MQPNNYLYTFSTNNITMKVATPYLLFCQCSKNCGVGVKVREIQCHDRRDQRSLRPFHCQATSPRPPVRIPCNIHSCLDWYTSSWGQVKHSEVLNVQLYGSQSRNKYCCSLYCIMFCSDSCSYCTLINHLVDL